VKCPACKKKANDSAEGSSLLYCRNSDCDIDTFVLNDDGSLQAYFLGGKWEGVNVRFPEEDDPLHVFNTKEI
jgi:hypothetical protein